MSGMNDEVVEEEVNGCCLSNNDCCQNDDGPMVCFQHVAGHLSDSELIKWGIDSALAVLYAAIKDYPEDERAYKAIKSTREWFANPVFNREDAYYYRVIHMETKGYNALKAINPDTQLPDQAHKEIYKHLIDDTLWDESSIQGASAMMSAGHCACTAAAYAGKHTSKYADDSVFKHHLMECINYAIMARGGYGSKGHDYIMSLIPAK